MMTERDSWSTGTAQERGERLQKSFVSRSRFPPPLFPVIAGVDRSNDEDDDSIIEKDFDEDDEECPVRKALQDLGYGDCDDDVVKCVKKALGDGGEIISKQTNKVLIEHEVPDEPPAFVRPDRLEIGDRVQLLNWVPMGVHGAKIDLYPTGNVTKMYIRKCLVSREPMRLGFMPEENVQYDEEDRLIGVELDGKGPIPMKSKGTPYPYITKDRTVILRFPPLGKPSGNTDHKEPWYS